MTSTPAPRRRSTFRTVHVLCGDLLVLHPDAFRQVAFKVA